MLIANCNDLHELGTKFNCLPFITIYFVGTTKIFQKYMKLAFDEVRNEVAN